MAPFIKLNTAEKEVTFGLFLLSTSQRLSERFDLPVIKTIRRPPANFGGSIFQVAITPVFGRPIDMVKAKQPKGLR